MRERVFYFVLVGFLVGVASNSFFELSLCTAIYVWIFCLLCFGANLFFRKKYPDIFVATPTTFLGVVFLLAVSTGILRYSYNIYVEPNYLLENSVGENFEFIGLVAEEPDSRELSTRLTVLPRGFVEKDSLENTPQKILGGDRILITTGLFPEFSYGDEISVSGFLKKPKNFETNNGREFNYVSYLAKNDIKYQMFLPNIKTISHGNGNFIKRNLLRLKQIFAGNLQKVIPEPHASLASGILVGAKHSLGKDIEDKFRQTGLIHVVVLSGYNVTIVADFIMRILSFLPKVVGVSGGVVGIFLFALITGGTATVVRASIMSLLVIIARATGRNYDILRALGVASCLMVFQNPRILMSDPAFELSCMATFALVACSPFFERHLQWLPEKFQIRGTVSSTLATQVFLLPMLVYMTGIVSLVGLATNLLVLVIVPATMLMSFLVGLAGFVSLFLSTIVGYFAYLFLNYMLSVVSIFASLPFAYLELPHISYWVVVTFYLVFGIIFVRRKVKGSAKEKSRGHGMPAAP